MFATSAVLVYAVVAVNVDDDDELDELAAADDDEGLPLLLPPQPDNVSALAQTAMSTYEWSFFTVHLLQLQIDEVSSLFWSVSAGW